MLVAVIGRDKPDSQQIRLDTRAAHLDYIESTGVVSQAGPLLDGNGQMVGSLIILDVPDMQAATTWVANDPYGKAGLFDGVGVMEWNKVRG